MSNMTDEQARLAPTISTNYKLIADLERPGLFSVARIADKQILGQFGSSAAAANWAAAQ